MGDWYRPRHLVLAVSSKIKVMCHSCILFIVFLIQCIPSHLQHNIIECMRGVYVLAKHSSFIKGMFRHAYLNLFLLAASYYPPVHYKKPLDDTIIRSKG